MCVLWDTPIYTHTSFHVLIFIEGSDLKPLQVCNVQETHKSTSNLPCCITGWACWVKTGHFKNCLFRFQPEKSAMFWLAIYIRPELATPGCKTVAGQTLYLVGMSNPVCTWVNSNVSMVVGCGHLTVWGVDGGWHAGAAPVVSKLWLSITLVIPLAMGWSHFS